jgi:hypothetical protein
LIFPAQSREGFGKFISGNLGGDTAARRAAHAVKNEG